MARFTAVVQVWPFHGGTEKEAGPREQRIEVEADDLEKALAKVLIFRQGITTNPHVWMAPIWSIARND